MPPHHPLIEQLIGLSKRGFHARPLPASPDEIAALEEEWELSLPSVHRMLLLHTNGCVIHTTGAVLNLGGLGDMEAWNDDDIIAEAIPGLFVIGDDGGGSFYAYDHHNTLGSGAYAVFLLSMGVLDAEEAVLVGSSLEQVIERVLAGQSWER